MPAILPQVVPRLYQVEGLGAEQQATDRPQPEDDRRATGLPRVRHLLARQRIRVEDRPHALGHPLQREDRGDLLQPTGDVLEGEVNARDELQHQGRRDDDGTDRSSRAERRIGNAENGAPETAEEEDPGQSQPATGVGGQLDIVEEARHEEQGDELRDRGGENESDLAEEVGHRRHRGAAQPLERAVIALHGHRHRHRLEAGQHDARSDQSGQEESARVHAGRLVRGAELASEDRREHDEQQDREEEVEEDGFLFARVHLEFEQGAFPSHGQRVHRATSPWSNRPRVHRRRRVVG